MISLPPDLAQFTSELATVAIPIGLAALMGAITGLEREKAEKPAGIRTMLLIGAGSATFALLGERLAFQADVPSNVTVDTTRVLSYLITGVGFLGGGAIVHARKSVHGLTTAATIWMVAALGATCGYREYDLAVVVFIIIQSALWLPRLLAKIGLLPKIETDAESADDDN